MNPYAMLATGPERATAAALAARLATWHDAMVAHERRLRTLRTGDVCYDECPHVEAPSLWAEALAAFGDRAHELSFLRSRATSHARARALAMTPRSRHAVRAEDDGGSDGTRSPFTREPGNRPAVDPSAREGRTTAEAEL